MNHPNSFSMLAYWDSLRAGQGAPERRSFDPAAVPALLPSIFILDLSGERPTFRLAGTGVCSAHMRQLRNFAFTSIWDDRDRRQVDVLASSVASNAHGAVIGSTAGTGSETVSFETLLLPVLDKDGRRSRSIGTISFFGKPRSLGNLPLGLHSLVSMRILADTPGPLRTGCENSEVPVIEFSRRGRIPEGTETRRVRHLTVIEGGSGLQRGG